MGKRARVYLSSNRRRTTWARTGTSVLPNRTSRDPNSLANIAGRLYPFRRSLRLSSLFYRYKNHRRKPRGHYNSDSGSPLDNRIITINVISPASQTPLRCVTFCTKFPFETKSTNTFPVRTVTVAVAIGHFTFVVSQITLFAFPSGVALAFAVNVFAPLTAQYWTNACDCKIKIAN